MATSSNLSPASIAQIGEMFEETFDRKFEEIFDRKFDPIKRSLDRKFDLIKRSLDRLEDLTGILVEDKARVLASQLFGIDFSQGYLIKSIHDVVKLLSKADDPALPRKHNFEQVHRNVGVVSEKLNFFRLSFAKSAVRIVQKRMSSGTMLAHEDFKNDHDLVAEAQAQLDAASAIGTAGSSVEEACTGAYGRLLRTIKSLSDDNPRGDEDNKMLAKRIDRFNSLVFKLKLARFRIADLESCQGPGVMMCCAISSAPTEIREDAVLLKKWIEQECDVLDYREEVECDMRGSVALVGKYASISCGEIKSSSKRHSGGVEQMETRANLIEFVLQVIFDNRFKDIVKKGHLFVLEGSPNYLSQNKSKHNGTISLFVHKV